MNVICKKKKKTFLVLT